VASALTIETILRRDRLVIGAALLGITALAWAYMVHEARAMGSTGVCHCAGMKMSGPDLQPWSALQLIPLFLMWAEMMLAMMLPSAAPIILTFAAVNRKRRENARPFVSTGIFMLGYLLVWTAFSAVAAVAQWALHSLSLLSPMMVSSSPVLAVVVLCGAGLFQWSPLKRSCLAHCASPLSFIMNDWREGKSGALFMGLKHGVYCTGCCWLLMALLFVAGVMNMWWVGVIAAFVLIEKAFPKSLLVSRFAGGVLLAWGLWLAVFLWL
jgi:predicted metal-binding membrane protein